jgi:hypothetical protein
VKFFTRLPRKQVNFWKNAAASKRLADDPVAAEPDCVTGKDVSPPTRRNYPPGKRDHLLFERVYLPGERV